MFGKGCHHRSLVEKGAVEVKPNGYRVYGPSCHFGHWHFLRGVLVVGQLRYPGGRQGEPAVKELSESLAGLGIELARFQSATPPRLHADTVDYAH